MSRILIVEDDRGLSAGLKYDFEKAGHKVYSAFTLQEGRNIFLQQQIELVLLDVNLPDGDGFGFCRWIKERRETPVVFLTARDMEEDAVTGYDIGADDYVTKPFSMVLLRKKAEAVLRRAGGREKEDIYEDGYIHIDFARAQARVGKEEIFFTPTEYRMLRMFIENKGQVLTHKVLLYRLWDSGGQFVDKHTLAVNINRLRGKIEQGGHKYIATVYGMGYQWIERQ